MDFETLVPIIINILLCSVGLIFIIKFVYEKNKERKKTDYKSELLSDAMKITDPTTGLPKNMVNKTQADDYLREARNMEQKKSINKNVDDF